MRIYPETTTQANPAQNSNSVQIRVPSAQNTAPATPPIQLKNVFTLNSQPYQIILNSENRSIECHILNSRINPQIQF